MASRGSVGAELREEFAGVVVKLRELVSTQIKFGNASH